MASTADISAVLANAQSADANLRNQAEAVLKQFESQNYAGYLHTLASELANNDKPADVRQIAGLILKNTLDAGDEIKKAQLVSRWNELPADVKQAVRTALLATLPTEAAAARATAALVIAKVAAIELPAKQWPDLISKLLSNMAAQPPSSALRQATLQALGYVCEEMGNLKEDILEQEAVNSILTAVVQGMRKDEPDAEVRLAATVALYNALEFAHSNFQNESERNYLMQVICEGTTSEVNRVREASFECLVKIAATYYETLPPYMETIFNLTHRAIKDDEEDVAKQAIEFWCTICEEEIDIQDAIEEGDTSLPYHHFVKQALTPLVTILLQQLTKQDEGQDKDDSNWNLSMAGGTCLGLAAATVADDIIPLVMPYVTANIDKKTSEEDWRYREAATFAFGSILDGPSVDQLANVVNSGLGFLLTALKDANSQVRHTTAWTIGRIFEYVHSADYNTSVPPIITAQTLPQIITVLLDSIRDEPHISEKVCYALSQLAAGYKDSAEGTSPLSPYFKDVVQALLETAARPCAEHEQARLQVQAFEAINEVVRCASQDTLPMVAQLIPLMNAKLGETFQLHTVTAEAKERQSELQGLLCGVLQVIIQKLSDHDAAKGQVLAFADQIMEVMLSVFACRSATVHEEAMLAVGALTYACGRQFVKYMERFFPVLEVGLANFQEWQVCQVSVGVLGDVARAIEDQVFPFCNRTMQILLTNLQSDSVHRNIKPQILSAFGDLALAIGDKFEIYLPHVLQMLQSAQQLSVQQQQAADEESFEYNNLLRHGIFEAYSGIFNGLSREKVNQYMAPYAPIILEYVEYVYRDKENRDTSVSKTAIALLGDIASNVSAAGTLFAQKPYFHEFLSEAQKDPDLHDTANWSMQVISKASSSS